MKLLIVETSHREKRYFDNVYQLALFLNTTETHIGKLRSIAKRYGYKTYY